MTRDSRASPRKGEGIYNVVVIGGGTAGLVAAAGTAGLGGRVALIERDRLGGECLNTGCVPSKALVASARVVDQMRHAAGWGLKPHEPDFDFDQVFARMRDRRARIAPHDSQERFEELGVDVFRGQATFASPHEVRVDGVALTARNFVIATGSRAAVPVIPGLEATPFYTNETIFDELPGRPARLAILGGGPVGCELGQVFARLGVGVTIVQRSPQILRKEDSDAAGLIRRRLEAEGVAVLTGAQVTAARRSGDAIRLAYEQEPDGERTLECDALLIAAGRAPNTDGLNLERAGVAFTKRGVTVNAFLQTSQPHVYAAGDITGLHRFTHMADHHARTVVRNILFPWFKAKREDAVVPWCTYTAPEVARVGLNESQAREGGIEYDLFLQDLEELDRAVVEEATTGFAKVLTVKRGDRILGVTLVCDRAGDLLPEFALAMKNGIGLEGIARTIHPYPTFAEIAGKIADQQLRSRLTPLARAVFSRLYRWRRG
jgi:pyruvate/2-oxoglutarate dehydrogenase complex dihydrolipoamide dehydrogenase (E3) component